MDNNRVFWDNIKGRSAYVFEFNGIFTHDSAKKLASRWKQDFSFLKTGKVDVIFNASEMKNYEPMARALWQKNINEQKQKIDQLWVISNSSLILAGAKMMGFFTSIKIRTTKDFSALKNELAA